MTVDISKLCADFLREHVAATSDQKLGASHARELVAFFFGYKSHAALLAEAIYPLSRLDEAKYLAPPIPLMDQRRKSLQGLPTEVPGSMELAQLLCDFLKNAGHFTGEAWIYETLETYVMEQFMTEHGYRLLDLLSGVMAETNAYFDDPQYEDAEVIEGDHEVVVDIDGKYYGSNDHDRPFSGDTIDMKVKVTLIRVCGKAGFSDYEMTADGSVNDDWYDPDYEAPSPVP